MTPAGWATGPSLSRPRPTGRAAVVLLEAHLDGPGLGGARSCVPVTECHICLYLINRLAMGMLVPIWCLASQHSCNSAQQLENQQVQHSLCFTGRLVLWIGRRNDPYSARVLPADTYGKVHAIEYWVV
jgi:hypothetical protein